LRATQPHIAVGGLLTDRDGHLVACRMGEREEAAGWNGVEQCGDDTARIVGVGDAVQDRDEHDRGRGEQGARVAEHDGVVSHVHRPCPGRDRLGDLVVFASMMHAAVHPTAVTALTFRRINSFLRPHLLPAPGAPCLPRTGGAS